MSEIILGGQGATDSIHVGRSSAQHGVYCFKCKRETAWFFAGSQNGSGPLVEYWTCARCRYRRMALADLTDAHALVLLVMNEQPLRDREEIEAHLTMHLWRAYTEWDSAQCSFRAFATTRLRQRLINYFRGESRRESGIDWSGSAAMAVNTNEGGTYAANGEDDETGKARSRPAVASAAGDTSTLKTDDRLGQALGPGAGDPEAGRLADLGRVLKRRDRSLARQEREMGL